MLYLYRSTVESENKERWKDREGNFHTGCRAFPCSRERHCTMDKLSFVAVVWEFSEIVH